MIKFTQLNSLANEAKKGCDKSKENILRFFIPIINKESEKVWYLLKDETYFEKECYRKIDQSIEIFNEEKGSFYYLVKRNILRTKSDCIKRFSINRAQIIPIEQELDNGYSIQLNDVLADVEDEILFNEKVALLAEGDSRKMAILNQWMKGCSDDRNLSKYLAERFDLKPESLRVFISRFKTKCQTLLEKAA